MERLLNTGLDKTARLAHVEENIGDAIIVVLSVKEAVGSALQWAGACVALQASSLYIRLFARNMLGLSESGRRDDESRRNYAGHPDDEI